MNDKQKLLVMFGTGSVLVFLITVFGLGFSPVHKWLDTSEINWEYEKSNVDFNIDTYHKDIRLIGKRRTLVLVQVDQFFQS